MATLKSPKHVKLMNMDKALRGKLTTLMKTYNIGTGAQAVIMTIENYKRLDENLTREKEQHLQLQREIEGFKQMLRQYFRLDKTLRDIADNG